MEIFLYEKGVCMGKSFFRVQNMVKNLGIAGNGCHCHTSIKFCFCISDLEYLRNKMLSFFLKNKLIFVVYSVYPYPFLFFTAFYKFSEKIFSFVKQNELIHAISVWCVIYDVWCALRTKFCTLGHNDINTK